MADYDNLDSWDPLTDHYNDPDKNTYDTGAGAKLPAQLQPANRRKNDSDVTLFIRPLNSRYNEDSLRNMFSDCGPVTDVRIIYPKNDDEKSPYAFVTYSKQSSANEAIRRFNDNNKFEFKVSFSKGGKQSDRNDRPPRNRDQPDKSRRINDSDRSQRDQDQPIAQPTTKEPDFNFKPKSARNADQSKENRRQKKPQNAQSQSQPLSEASWESASSSNENSKPNRNHSRAEAPLESASTPHENHTRPKKNQNIPSHSRTQPDTPSETSSAANENHRSRRNQNTQSHSRAPPTETPLQPSSAAVQKNVSEEEMKNVSFKKEPEVIPAMAARIKPLSCSVCQKLTFNICSICRKSFCHAECTLDGWRNHTSPDCVHAADLIRSETPASLAEPVANDRSANVTKNENDSAPNDRSMNNSNNLATKYASDANSPATQYREFANLVEDYRSSGNKSIEEVTSTAPKFNPVCDNNYDENTSKDTSFGMKQEPQAFSPPPSQQQQNRPRPPFRPHNDDQGGRGFKPRNDGDRSGPSEHERGPGRRFRNPDDKDGFNNDSSRGSGGGQNYGVNGAGDADRGFAGGRPHGGRQGFDNRRNFNDRQSRPQDEHDGAGANTRTESRPYRGGYRNDGEGFKGGPQPREGYRNRSKSQNRFDPTSDNVENNTSVEFTPRAHSSLVENNARSPIPAQAVQKVLELNKKSKVTVTFVEKDTQAYVRLAENETIFEKMCKTLKESTPAPFDTIINGSKCVVKYSNGWYRGSIRSESPVIAFLVDVGTTINDAEIRKVPEVGDVLAYRPFAVKVKMPKVPREDIWKWYTENTVITIEPIALQDNIFTVEYIPFEQQIAELVSQQSPASAPAPAPRPPVSAPTPAPPVESKPKIAANRGPAFRIGKPKEVIVTFIPSKTEFFCLLQDRFTELTRVLANIDVESLSPLETVQQGVLAYAPYLEEYSRVEILSLNPLQINFIDFGNIETVDASTLKVLPAECANIPPLAIKIKLYSGTTESNNVMELESVLITPLKMVNPTTYVAAVGDKSADYESLINAMDKPKSATPAPKVSIDLSITYAVSKSEVYGVPKSDISKLTELSEKLMARTGQFPPVREPELNKIYASPYEDMLCRCRLISLDPVKINFFDYGNTEECQIEDLFELPAEFHNNPAPLAKRMRLVKETKSILEFAQTVTALWDMDQDTYLITHDPTDPESALRGSASNLVNVVSALGDSNYAVILEENRDVYKYINWEINESLDELSKPKKIAVNEQCLAFYEDDNWHRAKIVSLSPLTVHFLDFANELKCDFAQLKEIPSYLAKIPPLAFKIKTEDYVELDEGSEVKIAKLEEIEYNYWKVGTLKEKTAGQKRIQIISDVKHIATANKKKPKSSGNTIMASLSKETGAIDESITSYVKSKSQRGNETGNINDGTHDAKVGPREVKNDDGKPPEKDVPREQRPVKPYVYDEKTCLLFTVMSNKPKNYAYPTNVNTLTNGVEHLALSDPIRNSTFDDINIPISDHLLDALRPGDNCVLIVYDTFSDGEYTGMLLCKRLQRLVDILDHIEKIAETDENCYSAKRGDCVVTYVEGINTWQRAYVVSEPSNVDPFYHVILFDVGKMHKTDQVYRLNEEFRRVPMLSVRINVTRFQPLPEDVARLEVVPMNFMLKEGDTYQHDKSIYNLTLKKKSEEGFEADLRSQFYLENMSHTVQLTKWHPNREEIGVKHVPVMDGDVVKIGYTCQTNQCYVIPIDDAINEQRNDFLSKVGLHCRKAESIEGELKLKEIVGVPYMKSYFRGQVIEKKMDSYLVHILDIGAEVKVPKNQAKRLPDNLKFADCYAVCVQLHNVPCTDFNQMSESFLKHVIVHENEFTLHINESSRLIELKFNDDVEALDINKGSDFNLRLSQLLLPLWKTETLDFGARFFLLQLKFEEWPIGSELSLAFVESVDEKSGFMINRYGETYAKLIRVNLEERLREYAEEVSDSYVPVKEELCIAKFNDQWFRAVCHLAEPGKPLHLQFIDIGYQRQVPHTDIRRMHADFLKHPAAALFCDVENYLDCKSLPELQGKVLKKCRVLRKLEDGGYAIRVANLKAYANA